MVLIDYLKLLRPGNCLMAAIATYIGYSVSAVGFAWHADVFLAMAVAFLVCGAGQAVNDYFDREIDAKIRPEKSIPSGRVKAKNVLVYSAILFLIGILISFFINWTAFTIALGFSLLLIIYSAWLHNFKYLGNWIVALGTAFTLVFGAAAAAGSYAIVGWLAFSALMVNVPREITKDLEDLKADKGKKHSLPMVLPLKGVKMVVLLLYGGGILAAFWVFVIGIVSSDGYLVFTACSAVVFAYACYKLLHNKYSTSHSLSKYAMLIALVAYLSILIF